MEDGASFTRRERSTIGSPCPRSSDSPAHSPDFSDARSDETPEGKSARLEWKCRQLEDKVMELEGVIHQISLVGPARSPRSPRLERSRDVNAETEKLQELITQAQVAKSEALRYSNVGKNQLAREVRELYGLLQKAKADRLQQEDQIRYLQKQVDKERVAKEEVIEKSILDRAAYRDMLREERKKIGEANEKFV